MIPFCADQGLGVLPWSPLARGLLTGRIKRPTKDEVDALFAKKTDVRNPNSTAGVKEC
jgi:aryl-alcohol dehydrogenase-like predicted oxidoreductase